jgi:hypothetical protein
MNGHSRAEDFEDQCIFLKKVRTHAGAIGTECNRIIGEAKAYLEETLAKVKQRLQIVDEAITDLITNSEGVECEQPSMTQAIYRWGQLFFFVAESCLTYVNLIYSDLGGYIAEAVLSMIFAAVLVAVADQLGKHYRRLPLARSSTKGSALRVYLELAGLFILILFILGAVTYFRARGLRMRGEADTSTTLTEFMLFLLGLGIAMCASWASGKLEYSGPRYGLAKLQRVKTLLTDLVRSVEAQIKNLDGLTVKMAELLEANIKRITHIYMDQYRRHERGVA